MMEHEEELYDQLEQTLESNEAEESFDRKPSLIIRIVALITLVAFISFIAAIYYRSFKDAALWGLVDKSANIKKTIDDNLSQSVVRVRVVARKNNSNLAVEEKMGTGFNIAPNGLIVTNHHVISDALNVLVEFPDGTVYKATKWFSKPEYDLALIELAAKELPAVNLDKRSCPDEGEKVIIVGNPLSLNNIAVEGTVLGYYLVEGKAEHVFTIDAPIYPGNSGSPVYSQSGLVTGVVFGNWHHTVDGRERTEGLAIPIEMLLSFTN